MRQWGLATFVQHRPAADWRVSAFVGLTRTRYRETLNALRDTAQGWRIDAATVVEYQAAERVRWRSTLVAAHERIGDSRVYGGRRAVTQTEWDNLLRLSLLPAQARLRPFVDAGVALVAHPALVSPGAGSHAAGEFGVGLEGDLRKDGESSFFLRVNRARGWSHYRSSGISGGVAVRF